MFKDCFKQKEILGHLSHSGDLLQLIFVRRRASVRRALTILHF
jgi:hypothetical protein